MENENIFTPNSIITSLVAEGESSVRIDKYLACQFPTYSRTFFVNLIERKSIHLNNTLVLKSSVVVKPTDHITIKVPPHIEDTISYERAHALDIRIVHTHDHFLIINKAAHIMTHRPLPTSPDYTVVEWLKANFTTIDTVGYAHRPGIVHRLDKDTSGLLIIARTPYAHTVFGDMFKQRALKKSYLAVVHGHPPASGTITAPIGRHQIHRNKMHAYPTYSLDKLLPNGIRHAHTTYTVVNYFKDTALVSIDLHTGRTHQIRVHFALLGHPIIGDTMYGKGSPHIGRQALHAHSLTFSFENHTHSFTQESPQDFNYLLEKLSR